MSELANRLIVITGGAGGIGRATAPLLLAEGAEEKQRQEWADFRAKLYTNWEF